MLSHSKTCHEHALHCLEVAENTHAPEDRCEFLSFAKSWERLASEIDQNERLVELIETLTTNASTEEDVELEKDGLGQYQQSGMQSLRRLATTILDHVVTLIGEPMDFEVGTDKASKF
jgi:hypothetical protein